MTLTKFPLNTRFDLLPWVGQRTATFRFDLINGITNQVLGALTPLRGASISHDTGRTVKRQLSLSLGVADMRAINSISDRVVPYIVAGGVSYPLGRFAFTDVSSQLFTSGRLGNIQLNDEMIIVDQPITAGITGEDIAANTLIAQTLNGLPNIVFRAEASPYAGIGSWGIGTSRGSILDNIALAGDFWNPWFDNEGILRFMRAFDPAREVPDFDFDAGASVMRIGIVENSDILSAPNTFIVVSNIQRGEGSSSTEVVGRATVPVNAPNSVANRGFEIVEVQNIQVKSQSQADAMARNLAQRSTIYERVTLSTPPDPRHDSYNVVRWQGANWLELAWSMALVEGGTMSHLLRKSYMA